MKSKYKYGDRSISELNKEELFECLETVWSEKNAKIAALEETVATYKKLIVSPHHIWRTFADNLVLLIYLMGIAFFLGAKF